VIAYTRLPRTSSCITVREVVRPGATGTYDVNHAYGTAARAVEYVDRLKRIGVDEVICLIQMGTVPHDAAMETIRQWGAHVIPHFRKDESR
jgi:hypothetical protein